MKRDKRFPIYQSETDEEIIRTDPRIKRFRKTLEGKFQLELSRDYAFDFDSNGRALRIKEATKRKCILMLNECTYSWQYLIDWGLDRGFELSEDDDGAQMLKKKFRYAEVQNWQGVKDDVRLKSAETIAKDDRTVWVCIPKHDFVTIGDHMKWPVDWPVEFTNEMSMLHWLNYNLVSWEENVRIMSTKGASLLKDCINNAPILVTSLSCKKVRTWSDVKNDPRVRDADTALTQGGPLYYVTLEHGFVRRGLLNEPHRDSFECISVKECSEIMNDRVVHWSQNVQVMRALNYQIHTNGRMEYLRK